MYYMKLRGTGTPEPSEEESGRSSFAPLNPAHLTHEPVRHLPPWARFTGAAAFGAAVVEALRRVVGH